MQKLSMNQHEIISSPIDVMAVARIDGTDRNLQEKIYTSLSESGIIAEMEGSIIFAVYVNRKDVDVAVQVLKSDVRLLKEKIIINDPVFRVNCPPHLLKGFSSEK